MIQKNSRTIRLELRFVLVDRLISGHREQVCKRHDGGKVQDSCNNGQNGTFGCLEGLHFFHADWILG